MIQIARTENAVTFVRARLPPSPGFSLPLAGVFEGVLEDHDNLYKR